MIVKADRTEYDVEVDVSEECFKRYMFDKLYELLDLPENRDEYVLKNNKVISIECIRDWESETVIRKATPLDKKVFEIINLLREET